MKLLILQKISNMMSLKIKKRSGDDASFNPQKIYNRIKRAAKGLNINSDAIFIKGALCIDSLLFRDDSTCLFVLILKLLPNSEI